MMYFAKFSMVYHDTEVRLAEWCTVWLRTVPARPYLETGIHCCIFCCIWHRRDLVLYISNP